MNGLMEYFFDIWTDNGVSELKCIFVEINIVICGLWHVRVYCEKS